jgi:tungstate transport system substrate-binding protein
MTVHPKGRRRTVVGVLALALATLLALTACSSTTPSGQTGTGTTEAKSSLILASTTSTQDSGLFDVLIPAFEKANPKYTTKVIAVGSGEALKLGEKKEADVLLVHSPAAEKTFMEKGYGIERSDVMYNNFVIIGPKEDPAKISAETSAGVAFKKIADSKATFVSRGDNSGTHAKELSIWKSQSIVPTGQPWYLVSGQGMGETLRIANEKKGYTLADEATYLSMQKSLQVVPLAAGASGLKNQYGVITVEGAKNLEGAKAFYTWIISPEGQKVIGTYGVEKYGKPLFTPNAPAQ